jgi:hypothetical protein
MYERRDERNIAAGGQSGADADGVALRDADVEIPVRELIREGMGPVCVA